MNTDRDSHEPQLPSKWQLAKATATATFVALALLVTVILPAEYGLDPLGTGAALGLMQLSASAPPPEEVAAPIAATTTPTPVVEGPVAHYAAEYKVDSIEFKIGPYEYVEYKYRLEKGASMICATQLLAHDEFRIIGTITKLQNSQLQVKTREGKNFSIKLNAETYIHRDKEKDKVAAVELKNGRSVVVDAR